MKVAVYGVSASGKDHLIGEIVAYLSERGIRMTHVRGSAVLERLSMERHGCGFSSIGEDDKDALRVAFADALVEREAEFGNVVVDGHFAFPTGDGAYRDVFTDSDLMAYDLFVYLDTDPDMVARRLAGRGVRMSPEDVGRWQDHEVNGLVTRLLPSGKELHVIHDDGEPTLRYILESMDGGWSSEAIARRAVGTLADIDVPGMICLVDCDRTLVEEDTTSLALGLQSKDGSVLADIYARDRYSNYQSFMAGEWLDANLAIDDDAIASICGSATPNTRLVASLAHAPGTRVVAITAGPAAIWSPLLDNMGVAAELLDTVGVMSKYVKYFVVRELQRLGHFVIAVGDSMLDSLMLAQADRAYVYAGKGRRASMARFLEANPKVRQFSFSAYQYPGTPSDGAVCWVDCLDQRDSAVAAEVAICKSGSGMVGRRLRDAHRWLGSMVGHRIAACNRDEEFAVVVMMRSGLPFGEGIADALDCPMLFYTDDVEALVAEIAADGLGGRTIVLADGVINTGRSLRELVDVLKNLQLVVAASVVSSEAHLKSDTQVFSARVSDNSYVGAKQWEISGGKGPDTADRLFMTM